MRRGSLRLLLSSFLLLLSLLAGCATVAPRPTRFKILQMNDVYKIEGLESGNLGGLARVRTLRKQLEADGSAVLLLHAGDALYPSVASKYLAARPIVDVMNLLDGDQERFDPALIVGFGNHEFDNKEANLLISRIADSQFQWLATNTKQCVESRCERGFARTQETLVYDVDGTRVGLFGVLYPMKKTYAASSDVIAAAKYAVSQLQRQRADIIIAIAHQDMADDLRMAREVEGIDLVIGGHDHVYLQERVGDTWITKADADAKSVIVYEVECASRCAVGDPKRVMLDTSVPKDETVDARVQEWMQTLAKELGGNETLGTTKYLLEGVEPAIRGRETALGNLLTDIAREQMGTDIALINGGSIRINDNIPPGPITDYELEGIFYYTNRLVAFPLTGQQLLEMLNISVKDADYADGRFLQVSGLRFVYSQRDGKFLVGPADVTVGGKPLDLNATYSVASTDFMHERGDEDEYLIFGNAATRPAKIKSEREADFRETVEKAIRARGTIDTNIEGRIVRR